jgi:predicted secreted protein
LPSKIELIVGEKYTLRLKGLGAAGYNWEYRIKETGKVISVSSEFVDDGKKIGPPPPGYSLDVLITIQALEPGHATIHFAQRRAWEKDKLPLKEHVLEIFVNSAIASS